MSGSSVDCGDAKARGVTIPQSVNYHFTRQCNYHCGFCFHTAKTSFVLPIDEAKHGLDLLRDAGRVLQATVPREQVQVRLWVSGRITLRNGGWRPIVVHGIRNFPIRKLSLEQHYIRVLKQEQCPLFGKVDYLVWYFCNL